MAFELFDKSWAARQGEMYLSLQRRGILSLNHPAYAALGEPKAVLLYFDVKTLRIGLQAADPEAPNAHRVRDGSNGASHLITATAFCNYWGISTNASFRLKAKLEGPMLIAQFHSDVIVV